MAKLHLAALFSGFWYCARSLAVTLSWHTGTLEYNRDIVNVIVIISFPAVKKAFQAQSVHSHTVVEV